MLFYKASVGNLYCSVAQGWVPVLGQGYLLRTF